MPPARTPLRRWWWAAALAVVAVAAVVAVTAGGDDSAGTAVPPPATSPPPASAPATGVPATGKVVSALDAGAKGDGRADDTRALEQALHSLQPGDTLSLPAGRTFAHDEVLHIASPGVTISGGGVLLATDEENSAVQVNADDVTLSGITVQTARTTQRWTAPEQTGVWLDGHSGVVLTDVTVIGSASAGVFVQGTQNFTITGAHVRDTRADGIHMTAGAAHGLVQDVLTENTGDDGVAVVSYSDDREQAQDIRIDAPHVHGNTNGRGVTVVGGKDVTVTDVDIRDTAAAAIYVACERGSYDTRVPSNVTVTGGTVEHANQERDVDHGAVLIYNAQGSQPLSNVTVSDIAISDTRSSASRQVGLISDDDGPITGVTLSGLSFTGSGPDDLLATDTDRLQFRATGWTLDGAAVPDKNVDEE